MEYVTVHETSFFPGAFFARQLREIRSGNIPGYLTVLPITWEEQRSWLLM
jgi:hypothetical protein